MTGPRAALVTSAAGATALVLSLFGCGLSLSMHPGIGPAVTAPAVRKSVLIVVTDPDSAAALKAAAALVTTTARASERILVLSDRNGVVLATSLAPTPPIVRVTVAPPAPLPGHPTSFEQASHARAAQGYAAAVRQAQSLLTRQQRAELTAWAKSVMATAANAGARGAGARGSADTEPGVGLNAAATALASLREAGTSAGTPVVVVIADVDAAAARSVSGVSAGLQDCSVVVDDFAGDSGEEAAWQEALLQAGASRVTMLVPATNSQLAPVVRQGLEGSVTDTLTSVLFGPGQYSLSRAAMPQLTQLLRLLTVRYPRATATIDGYTDNLPVSGGNLRLSELRAQAVMNWLIGQGVAAGRLQAFGYGATDPIVPNTPVGQPLNRRVVAVIDPALG
jgi:outer membrane protein OmpA-like peptidoglycan-associated protein